MTNADELFNEVTSYGEDEMDYERFKKAISEHDKEIVDKIDEMIIKENSGEHLKTCSRLVIQALTELKQFIQGEIK